MLTGSSNVVAVAILALFALVAWGLAELEAPALAEEPPRAASSSWKVPLEGAMHESFAHATDVVYYVILGDLDKAKAEGAALQAMERFFGLTYGGDGEGPDSLPDEGETP